MKVYGEQITQWAQMQYGQLKSTFNPNNKILIPYAISDFKVDAKDDCLLQVYTKRKQWEYITVKECADRMINEGARIAINLSGFIRGEKRHIDTYVPIYAVHPRLLDNDILIFPVRNSGVLTVFSTEKYTLDSFIRREAEERKVELEEQNIENFLYTLLGPSDMMYLTVKRS